MKHLRFIILVLFTSVPSSFGQKDDLVQAEGIKPGLHADNVATIFFTQERINTDDLKSTDFLDSYTLTNKSDLFFVAYFANSLTNFKHHLVPGMSLDSLYKKGNYRFTLFVDNRKIYQSDLLPGAPSQKNQDTATLLNRPLIDNKNGQGSWSESFWNRFLANGGDAALTDGDHMLKMEIRPYILADKVLEGAVIASGELALHVKRNEPIDISGISLNELAPYNGLAVSEEPFDRLKIRELKGAIEQGLYKNINAIIVIKEGKLLIEEYFNGYERGTLHDPRSVGKSFASTLAGKAIYDGHIKNEGQPLGDFYNISDYENYSEAKKAASIKSLLTMSSGFDGNDEDYSSPGNEENMYPANDWVKFALSLRYDQKTEKKWKYFTAGVVLLGDIINKSVPGGMEEYAEEKLFSPLGITNYEWQYTPQQLPNTAGGIKMNALDFAKYGQLYKNGGTWDNQRILAKDWVEKSLAKQIRIEGRTNEYYGYFFWNKLFAVGDKLYEASYCAGNGGNYILIFRDLPLVIVIAASAYGQSYAHPQAAKMLSEYILPAVITDSD